MVPLAVLLLLTAAATGVLLVRAGEGERTR
jgi:hypothetical protein